MYIYRYDCYIFNLDHEETFEHFYIVSGRIGKVVASYGVVVRWILCRGCADLYCASGAHGYCLERVWVTASQSDLLSLTPWSA